MEHESDLGYGKGYALVNNEFHRVLTKLAHLPYGLVLISHAQEIEIETRTGRLSEVMDMDYGAFVEAFNATAAPASANAASAPKKASTANAAQPNSK